jgi:drug/metabolite transporter (DMT)-like permease
VLRSPNRSCYLLILRTSACRTTHIAGQLADATAGAVVGSLALGLVLGGLQPDLPWSSLRWLLVLLVSQTAGWLLITASLPRLPAAMSSLVLLLQPAAALLLAGVVLGERPRSCNWLAPPSSALACW